MGITLQCPYQRLNSEQYYRDELLVERSYSGASDAHKLVLAGDRTSLVAMNQAKPSRIE